MLAQYTRDFILPKKICLNASGIGRLSIDRATPRFNVFKL